LTPGAEMRAAVLHLAFAGLGTAEAVSGAFEDNLAFHAVSRKLGYERAGSAEAGEGLCVAVHAVPDGDVGVAGCDGEGLDRDAGFGGDGGRCGNRQPSCLSSPCWLCRRLS
jgi:hypothetical protein